jgi:pimeloyl-ACP methyl ester carboxylesterase
MQKEIRFRNITGYYVAEGAGIPVMLVHGFCGEGSVWNEMIRLFPPDFKLIIPDLPGYGKSVMNQIDVAGDEISIELYAEYLHAIAEQENLPPFNLIGHSMGGYAALAFAEMFPQHIQKLCLFHSHPFEDTDEKKESRRKAIEFIEKYGTGLFTDELYNNLFALEYQSQHPEKVKAIKEKAACYSPATLITSLLAMIRRKNRAEILKNLSIPVLLIIGRLDKAIDYNISLAMCSLAPITEVHILPNVGHMGMIEAPEQTAAIICNFINTRF